LKNHGSDATFSRIDSFFFLFQAMVQCAARVCIAFFMPPGLAPSKVWKCIPYTLLSILFFGLDADLATLLWSFISLQVVLCVLVCFIVSFVTLV
jgi:hypothetical protein